MALNNSIQNLLKGETIASSRLSKSLVAELMSEGLLVPVIRGSRQSYRARDIDALRRYLIDKDEHYRLLEVAADEKLTRASMASETGNSKLVAVHSCPGFPVNAYEPICSKLNGEDITINPIEGSFVFVSNWQRFEVPADVTIVGIENMENFRKIRQQRDFFEKEISAKKLLFVSRYPQSKDLRQWLERIPNQYIHFGDFDLAGINIFLTEFYRYLSVRSSYLIPKDIEERLRIGSTARYDEQYAKFKLLSSELPEVQRLIDIIHLFRKGYDQEGYISSVY